MAQTYITIDDITNTKIRSYSPTGLQPYLDRTNQWYEDLAMGKGLLPSEVAYPAPQMCKDLLVARLQRDFAKDRIGGSNMSSNPNDVYVIIYGAEAKSYSDLVVRVTRELIRGEINQYSSTTIFGTRRGAYQREVFWTD